MLLFPALLAMFCVFSTYAAAQGIWVGELLVIQITEAAEDEDHARSYFLNAGDKTFQLQMSSYIGQTANLASGMGKPFPQMLVVKH